VVLQAWPLFGVAIILDPKPPSDVSIAARRLPAIGSIL